VVNAQDGYGIYFFKSEHGGYGWAGADYNLAGKAFLRAIDYRTGKIAWEHPIGDGAGTAGVLTTAAGLTISGDNRLSVMALRTSDGTTLWHAAIGKVNNGPIAYELDGRQYVVVGGQLYVSRRRRRTGPMIRARWLQALVRRLPTLPPIRSE
jgi:alcohol dehydrogenase (cytochrome c)